MRRAAIECVCSGTDREMGFTQGQTLKAKIHGMWKSMAELEAFRMEQPAWLPYGLYLRLAASKAAKALLPALQQNHPSMLTRLEGISAGSGLPARGLCLMNAMEAMLASVQGRTVPASPGACSAIGIRATHATIQEPILAKNLDYIPLVEPFLVVRENRPARGLRSLQLMVAPMAGGLDGINEKGLCIAYNYAFAADAPRPAPLISMAITEALSGCKDVAGAVAYISRRPRWGGGILMLADAAGGLACLELTNTRSGVRRAAPSEDWLTCTNVCRCPELRDVQIPDGAVFSDHVPEKLRGKPVLQWHANRGCRIEELIRARTKIGPEEMAAIMSDHGATGVADGSSPCVHTEYWRTTATMQFYPARRRVRVSYGTACAAKYVEFGL